MNSDFKDLLQTFNDSEVDYLVVGGYAVIRYTQPRYTKDLDVWLRPSPENAQRVVDAFAAFGIGLLGDVGKDDFASPDLMFSVGVAPVRIDFLTSLPPLDFQNCWNRRETVQTDSGLTIHYLSKADLIAAKTQAGRPQDLADLDELKRSDDQDN